MIIRIRKDNFRQQKRSLYLSSRRKEVVSIDWEEV
jgi:hypothetical protein